MCFVWKSVWILVVTMSLVSCSVSPRRRNTKYRVLSLVDFVVHLCTCSQTVFCDRQFSSVANYCTLHHLENGSFEVLSLQGSHRVETGFIRNQHHESVSEEKRDRDQNVVQSSRDMQNLQKNPPNRPSEEKSGQQKPFKKKS